MDMNTQFWVNVGEKKKLSNSKLIDFIEECGFTRVKLSDTNYVLAKINNNRLRLSTEGEITKLVKDYLLEKNELSLLEDYTKSLGSYISPKKLELLNSIKLINDRDSKDDSNFYFSNCYCNVTADTIQVLDYSQLKFMIWENRVLQREFDVSDGEQGQFEKFCMKISGNDQSRFIELKTIIGYLLHRSKVRGEAKSVILYDKNMMMSNQAHGGTGKSLLAEAIKKCREVEIFNAKDIKVGSWFINQRINPTTDLIVYDDLKKGFGFEHFFSMITGGIEVEKKHQHSFYIEKLDSPKILISSNYYVKGPGGSSDERRRYEFEIENYYSESFTPEDDFGNRFFDGWDIQEWNRFYCFMMRCTQEYLRRGLKQDLSASLKKVKFEQNTSVEFVKFADDYFEYNKKMDKREYLQIFKEFFPHYSTLSSHMFTKWIKDYSIRMGYAYADSSTGGDYFFELKKKEVSNG